MSVTQETIENRPLSYSSLKEFKKSPVHYVEYLKKPWIQTDAMRFGSMVDCLALEPEKFKDRFMEIPEINRRTNAGKAEYQLFLDQAIEEKKTMYSNDELERAKICVENLYSHPEASELLNNKVRVQRKLKWTEKNVNIPMIGYIDVESVISSGEWFCDLKTARSAQIDDFRRDISNLDYHLQAGVYAIGYHKCFYKFPEFAWIVVENTEPYMVNVIHMPRQEVEKAKAEVRGLLSAFRKCLDEDLFHEGYRFWLFETRKYYSFQIPKWKESHIVSFEDEE